MKKILSTKILLTLLICMVCTTTFADDGGTCGENLTWTYVEATKTLTISGSGAMIDAFASGYPWYNYRESISKVVLENGVTNIGSYAFAGCTSLHSITIPNSVSNVGSNAFQGIKKVIWLTNTPPFGWQSAKGTVNYVSNNQFGTTNDIIIYPFLSSMFEVDGIKYVPVSPSERTCDVIDCVYDESKTEVNINTTVTYQGIDMKVINVQPYTFYQNPYLKKVNLDISGRLSQYALSNCQNLQIALLGNNITNIDDYAFSGCRKLGGIIIPDEVNAIGQYAFSDCSEMTSVHVGEKTSIIGQYAFLNCSSITSVTIGNSTKTIGKYAFSGCSNLSSLSYGNNLRYIQQYAFSGCSSLSEFLIPGSVHTVEDYAFENCNSLRVVSIIDNDNDINDNDIVIRTFEDTGAHYYSGSKQRTDTIFSVFVSEKDKLSLDYKIEGYDCVIYINTPSGNTRIEKRGSGNYVNTFDKAGLLTITFNSGTTLSNQSCSITNIQQTESEILGLSSNKEYSLFFNCPLDSVYISRKISFALSPFQNNATLRSSVITGEEEKISSKEFFGCTNLQEVQIGNGVTSIGDWAFSGCSSLKSLSFGTQLKTIGKEAFSDCASVTKIVSKAQTPPTCSTQALDDINKWNCTLTVPVGSMAAYQAADQWKDFFYISEGDGGDNPPTPETQKCEKPTISYENGKLTFTSETEGAVCQYSITDTDIKAGSGNEVQLGVTYNISVFAAKSGYENSETATATLCWIDQQSKTEDITNGIANVAAQAVLIQSEGGSIKVQGVDEGTQVNVYGVNGTQAGSAISQSGAATINTNLQPGSIAIVKIGQKSVKVVMK